MRASVQVLQSPAVPVQKHAYVFASRLRGDLARVNELLFGHVDCRQFGYASYSPDAVQKLPLTFEGD